MTTRIVHATAPKRSRHKKPRAVPLTIPVVVDHSVKRHAEHVAALTMNPLDVCPPSEISFRELFTEQEQGDEEIASLADALDALTSEWRASSRPPT
jgi:hypothetical protein